MNRRRINKSNKWNWINPTQNKEKGIKNKTIESSLLGTVTYLICRYRNRSDRRGERINTSSGSASALAISLGIESMDTERCSISISSMVAADGTGMQSLL
mmetsp:Transcript_55431/g.62746  ORF Transcript_55431/g.62746 Transcript_55431/m.62746 type:complete len:100 (-) Transcript_55431:283-582(-)